VDVSYFAGLAFDFPDRAGGSAFRFRVFVLFLAGRDCILHVAIQQLYQEQVIDIQNEWHEKRPALTGGLFFNSGSILFIE
jgi:hypothetical protein